MAVAFARRPPWRVAVTRDEGPDGPLSTALGREGFVPVGCAVMIAAAPLDTTALAQIAARLDDFEWVVVASARLVQALTAARASVWPGSVRTAAVGRRTAAALERAGAQAPLLGAGDGAEALWETLREAGPWAGRRVLVPTTPGGRRTLVDALAAAGAVVTEVETYRMIARAPAAIAASWTAAQPEAVVVASPRVAEALTDAVGVTALSSLRGVVAIGATTAAALTARAIACVVSPTAAFDDAARALAGVRTAEVTR